MKKLISSLAAIAMLSSTFTTLPANALGNGAADADIYEPSAVVTLGAKPAQVRVSSSYSASSNAVRINWGKVKGATGYRVYRYNGEKWVKVANTRTTNCRIGGLKSGTKYKFKVKAFKRTSKGTVWGKASAVKNVATKPSTPKFKGFSTTESSVRLNWSKVKCDGYQIFQKVGSKYKRIATVKGSDVTYKVNGLDASTKYSFKIRAYTRDADGKVQFSSFVTKGKTTSAIYWSPLMKAWYECMILEANEEQIKMVEHDLTQATIDYCNGKTEFVCFEGYEAEMKIYAEEPVNFIENDKLSFEGNNAHCNEAAEFGQNNDCWLEKNTDSDKYKLTEQERYDCVKEFRDFELECIKNIPASIYFEQQHDVENYTIEGGDWHIYWSMHELTENQWWFWFCNEPVYDHNK